MQIAEVENNFKNNMTFELFTKLKLKGIESLTQTQIF